MNKTYTATDKVRDLIDDNSLLLLAISRFGIPLGFGDATVGEVCDRQNVDCDTFLTVANYIGRRPYNPERVELSALMGYLRRAHNYYLDYLLPQIGKKLVDVIGHRGESEVCGLLMRYYDEYVDEVRRHMNHENDTVFSYVENLLAGQLVEGVTFESSAPPHADMTARLRDLKDIIIRYYPQKNGDTLNSVLLDLITCERDLKSHTLIEDTLFSPKVRQLELSLRRRNRNSDSESMGPQRVDDKLQSLTEREKEVIRCVAKGMANKEIADALCLSVHTITTYRHNISVKLDIHSPSGLTIFAIINKLVDIAELSPS